MTTSNSALQSAACHFLAIHGPMAIEPAAASSLRAAVQAFAAGAIDADGLRAAVAGDRGTPPRSPASSTAVLELVGVLTAGPSLFTMLDMGTSIRNFTGKLAHAAADRSVKTIVVYVDSPGGSIRLIPETAALLRAARLTKPVVAVVGGLAASAGYWLAANASQIIATPSASVGAIGVFAQRADVSEQLAREGIKVATIAAGKFKTEGLETEPMTAAERAHLQATVDRAYADFLGDIAAGRQVPEATIRSGFGEGRLLRADDALKAGMIDRVATVEDAFARVAHAPEAMAALHAGRGHLTAAVLTPRREAQVRAELSERRRQLEAAARRPIA